MNASMPNASVSATHLLWAGRWIEATKVRVNGEDGWRFRNGRDAADWLAYSPASGVGGEKPGTDFPEGVVPATPEEVLALLAVAEAAKAYVEALDDWTLIGDEEVSLALSHADAALRAALAGLDA